MIGKYIDRYFITKRLGSGSLGETYLAESLLDQREWVIKIIDPHLTKKPGFVSEIVDLGKQDSPHVLDFSYEISSEQHHYLVMESLPSNLQMHLTKLRLCKKEIEAKTAVSLILYILTRLRTTEFTQFSIHGALHPRNMLLKFDSSSKPQEIILSDFGQAEWVRQATADDDRPYRGLAPYTPEALWEPPDEAPHPADSRADIFALGHLLYFLLTDKQLRLDTADAKEEFKRLADIITRQEAQVVSDVPGAQDDQEKKKIFEDYAKYAAITAIRIYSYAPQEAKHGQLWQHTLEQISNGEFKLATLHNDIAMAKAKEEAEADDETMTTDAVVEGEPDSQANEPPAATAESEKEIDPIWETPDVSETSDASEAQLSLPGIDLDNLTQTAANGTASQIDEKRPSSINTYIEISHRDPATQQYPRYFVPRANQGLITVGSAADKDITLPGDDRIEVQHLEIRRLADSWKLYAKDSGVLYNESQLSTAESRVWQPDKLLSLGNYQLRLHQPAKGDDNRLINLELLPAQLEIKPGFQKTVGITVRNNGRERSYFKLSYEDLGTVKTTPAANNQNGAAADSSKPDADAGEPNWFTLPQDGVVLNPGEQHDLSLNVQVPPDAPSQTRFYTILAQRLGRDGDQPTYQEQKGEVRVEAVSDFNTRLLPEGLNRTGQYKLIIANTSNLTQEYRVESQEPLQALEFAPFAAVTESIRESQTPPSPKSSPAQNGSASGQFGAIGRQLSQLTNRTEAGQNIRNAAFTFQQQKRKIRQTADLLGIAKLQTNLDFPQDLPKLHYKELYQFNKLLIPSGEQAVLLFVVQPQKRPFRWQPAKELPFELTITADSTGEVATEKAVYQRRSRLSRAQWTLLLGLILVACLLLSGWAAFGTSKVSANFQATHAAAAAFGRGDSDGDGLASAVELSQYNTDPHNPDSDGDGLSDGFEAGYEIANLICPTKVDCNGNGIPDPVEIRFATPTPTQPGNEPFATAEPTATPTRLPTVTPTAVSPPARPTQLAAFPYTGSSMSLRLGDDAQNKPQVIDLTFDTSSLPARAIIEEANLLVVMMNPEEYGRLQQTLGNIYLTEGSPASNEQLDGVTISTPGDLTTLNQMDLAPNSDNILIAKLAIVSRDDVDNVQIRLFFELGSNQDNRADILEIWSNYEQQTNPEHPPTLYLFYSLGEN